MITCKKYAVSYLFHQMPYEDTVKNRIVIKQPSTERFVLLYRYAGDALVKVNVKGISAGISDIHVSYFYHFFIFFSRVLCCRYRSFILYLYRHSKSLVEFKTNFIGCSSRGGLNSLAHKPNLTDHVAITARLLRMHFQRSGIFLRCNSSQ